MMSIPTSKVFLAIGRGSKSVLFDDPSARPHQYLRRLGPRGPSFRRVIRCGMPETHDFV